MKDILYRLALRITLSREEAEDIVQDTLIRVWNRRDSWDTIENIEAFALTVCRNMALDRLRLHENQNASLDDTPVESNPTATANPYERTVQREKVQIVRQLIDALPEKQRACMQLHHDNIPGMYLFRSQPSIRICSFPRNSEKVRVEGALVGDFSRFPLHLL